MTPVPPPASPCVRVNLTYTDTVGSLLGSRFFLSYGGSDPTAANCAALASDIAGFWETDLAPVTSDNYTLTVVDVLDIATDTGASGIADVSHPGGLTSSGVPSSVCMNVEFNISRRYRGGKPRMYLPGGVFSDLEDISHWTADYVAAVNTAVAAFFAAIEADSQGPLTGMHHVNLSYYKGFTNVTNSSGRERAAPTYRAAALLDTVTGYSAKLVVGSQRRRRTSTSP